MTILVQNDQKALIPQWLEDKGVYINDETVVKAAESVFTAIALAANQRNPTLLGGYNTTLFAQSATDLLSQSNLLPPNPSQITSEDLMIYHTILSGVTALMGPGKDAVSTILSSPQIVHTVCQSKEFKTLRQQLRVSCAKFLATKGAKKIFKELCKFPKTPNPSEMFQNLETSIKNYLFGCKKNLRAIQAAGDKLISELQTSQISLDTANVAIDSGIKAHKAVSEILNPQISTVKPTSPASPGLLSNIYNTWSLMGSSKIAKFTPLATLNPKSTASDVVISTLGVFAAQYYNAPFSAFLLTSLISRYLPSDFKNISALEPISQSMQNKWSYLSKTITDVTNKLEDDLLKAGCPVEMASQIKGAIAQTCAVCLLAHLMPTASPLVAALSTDTTLLYLSNLLDNLQLADKKTFISEQGYLFKLPYFIWIGALISGSSLALSLFQSCLGTEIPPEMESQVALTYNFLAGLMTMPVVSDMVVNSREYQDFVLNPLLSYLQTQLDLEDIPLIEYLKIANVGTKAFSLLPIQSTAQGVSNLAKASMGIAGGAFVALNPLVREVFDSMKSIGMSFINTGAKLYSTTQATNILQTFLGLPLAAAATTLPFLVSDPKSMKSVVLASTTASTAYVTGSSAAAAATSYVINSLDYSQYMIYCMALLHIAALYTFMNY